MSLNSSITKLAEAFAANVLAAIRSASLEEILAEGKGGGGAAAAPAKRGPGRPRKQAAVAAAPAPAKAAPAKKGKGGRLPRRSESDLQHVVGLIVAKLGEKGSQGGLRSEQLQKALKLSKKEIVGPLNLALEAKKIVKKGQRRATTYFAK